ncbi:MAG: endonuclease/exonuclease/phosphatase family protein [Cyanobacteria bacterium J06600_6]
MTSILFWNINKKPLLEEIKELCIDNDVDILILAECNLSNDNILEAINLKSKIKYTAPLNLVSNLSFFCRYPIQFVIPIQDERRILIRELSLASKNSFTLVALHLPSKLHMSEIEQGFNAVRAASIIKEVEAKVGHDRTLVIGDFNMNPFEVGMVSADTFHAVMDRNIASQVSRKVQDETCKYFYNPMWRLMGNDSNDYLGTYYYRDGSISYFWNTFDQVLLRSSLLIKFKSEDVAIISKIRQKNLIINNKIDKCFSDHLPIVIRLNI